MGASLIALPAAFVELRRGVGFRWAVVLWATTALVIALGWQLREPALARIERSREAALRRAAEPLVEHLLEVSRSGVEEIGSLPEVARPFHLLTCLGVGYELSVESRSPERFDVCFEGGQAARVRGSHGGGGEAFDARRWREDPASRRGMLRSVVRRIATERPSRSAVEAMLGAADAEVREHQLWLGERCCLLDVRVSAAGAEGRLDRTCNLDLADLVLRSGREPNFD